MKILGTGLNGLVGSRVAELLGTFHQFENISRATGVDITKKERVRRVVLASQAPLVIHFAAKTDVDGCEKDEALGTKGEAWIVNVEGTRNIAHACEESGKKLIHISTDFVFSGLDTPAEGYAEEDACAPVNWYGQTKLEAEKIVQSSKNKFIIVRIGNPYRAHFSKIDFARGIMSRLENGKGVNAVTDNVMTPTFIDDIATALNTLIQTNQKGIFHVVGSQSLTAFEAATFIAKTFGLNHSLIQEITNEEFFKDRAQRPFHLKIRNDKITKLGVLMSSFEEGLQTIKSQREQLRNL